MCVRTRDGRLVHSQPGHGFGQRQLPGAQPVLWHEVVDVRAGGILLGHPGRGAEVSCRHRHRGRPDPAAVNVPVCEAGQRFGGRVGRPHLCRMPAVTRSSADDRTRREKLPVTVAAQKVQVSALSQRLRQAREPRHPDRGRPQQVKQENQWRPAGRGQRGEPFSTRRWRPRHLRVWSFSVIASARWNIFSTMPRIGSGSSCASTQWSAGADTTDGAIFPPRTTT